MSKANLISMTNSMPVLYIGLLAVFVYVWIKYSQRKEDTNTSLSGDGWNVYRNNETIVSIPVANTRETAVIIGGMYQSDEEWMFEQIPEQIKRERCIVLGPWTQSVDTTIVEGISVLNQNNRNPSWTSLSGFSAGGYRVSEWYNTGQKWFETVFLIDPALEMETILKKTWGAEVILAFGSNPMENLYSAEYAYLSNRIETAGGIVINTEMYHYEYPSFLFTQYQYNI